MVNGQWIECKDVVRVGKGQKRGKESRSQGVKVFKTVGNRTLEKNHVPGPDGKKSDQMIAPDGFLPGGRQMGRGL